MIITVKVEPGNQLYLGRTGTKKFELLTQIMAVLARAQKPLLVKEISSRLRGEPARDLLLEQQITAPLRLMEGAGLAKRHHQRWEPAYGGVVYTYPGWTITNKGRLIRKQLKNWPTPAVTPDKKRSFRVYIRRSSMGQNCFGLIFDPSLGEKGWALHNPSCQNAVMRVLTDDRDDCKCTIVSGLSSRYCTIQLKRRKGYSFERGGLYIAEAIAKQIESVLNDS